MIIGNPPYNAGQLNENDNNKNRKYRVVDGRIRDTYAKDSKATLKNKLYDPYVKFFRWATDRLQRARPGIVCMVTNNSFVDQVAFDGMRQHLLADFPRVYHVDLHGNVRQNPKIEWDNPQCIRDSGWRRDYDCRETGSEEEATCAISSRPESWRKEQKLAWLAGARSYSKVQWNRLRPDARNTWLVPENADSFAACIPLGDKGLSAAGR